MGTNAELAAWLADLSRGWRDDRRDVALEIVNVLNAPPPTARKWEYLDLCPDSSAGYAAMLQAGEEGWEAACSWVEEHHFGGAAPRRINHILYKRPV